MAGNPHILIVGFGSAGRRHAQNLAQRGARISVVDTRADRLMAPGELRLEASHRSVSEALAAGRFDGAVIATPTAFHVEQSEQLIAAGSRILLEKPLSLDLASARRLAEAEARAGRPVLMGYTWRWWSALRELRARLHGGAIGRPLRAELVMASHLADWHPWEPLSDFFMSNAALGGGALLDESHWIDQMLWLFGAPDEIAAHVERVSALPIDSDDHVELQAIYADGLRARVHLDLYSRPTERSIAIFGDAGALKWSFESNIVAECHGADQVWDETRIAGERNDMFDALAGEFLALCATGAQPSCSLAEGMEVMRVIEAARMSQARGGAKVKLASVG